MNVQIGNRYSVKYVSLFQMVATIIGGGQRLLDVLFGIIKAVYSLLEVPTAYRRTAAPSKDLLSRVQ